jgi:ArsR family transcriptional regulator
MMYGHDVCVVAIVAAAPGGAKGQQSGKPCVDPRRRTIPSEHNRQPSREVAGAMNGKGDESTPTIQSFANAAHTLRTMSDPVRLRILGLLMQDEQSVSDLSSLIGLSQQSLGHHLSVLTLHELIVFRKEGVCIVYAMTDTGRQAMAAVTRLMRRGTPGEDDVIGA